MSRKKKGYQSGFYTTPSGNPYHALVNNASQETMDAIASLVDHVHQQLAETCPQCNRTGRWHFEDKKTICECGYEQPPRQPKTEDQPPRS